MLTFISFIFVFGMIVFIHEFGHFLLARANGIFVKEFSLGMGPRLYSRQGKETLYSIKAFPIGGSVQMIGEDEESDLPNSFGQKAAWRRFTVIVAGPVMNFVLAIFLLFVISLSIGFQTTTIGEFVTGLPAGDSTLNVGDEIIVVNDTKIEAWNQLTVAINESGGEPVRIQTINNGKIAAHDILPIYNEEEDRYLIGIVPTVEKSVLKAMDYSLTTTAELTKMILEFIPRLVSGQESMQNVAGPVGIAKVVGQAASMGLAPLLTFTAFISINLGIMNLLPIPALDGGRILLIAYEMIFRRKVNPKIEERIHYVGFLLLMALMVVVLFNDVFNLIRG
ncbi:MULTISPECIES: RIP metalloprotease RseP [unclassified Fusibacter]|uniref:RIP metalloprotease RseP n=1 Tax=unclassified Fusibacter TaxID=2624464 RepID=UPI00101248C7|nr:MULTISPECIES: RIP metalloprotease RseP [unclassified Fusibacter]MCK8058796.1 RIP metalloprotease RseP [Fusibacter sp. A2]NPE21870.1 RIP metalloprotease RseP [Fusibacter sp. A1]RXV61442.1 RIP metalloprotease RseP [Fusibacter sp. A1]